MSEIVALHDLGNEVWLALNILLAFIKSLTRNALQGEMGIGPVPRADQYDPYRESLWFKLPPTRGHQTALLMRYLNRYFTYIEVTCE